MNTGTQELNERLAALKTEFANRCLAEADKLARIGHGDHEALIAKTQLQDLRDAMHRIAGTSGIFDLTELSKSASAFEDMLRDGASDAKVRAEARNMAQLIRETFESQAAPAKPSIS